MEPSQALRSFSGIAQKQQPDQGMPECNLELGNSMRPACMEKCPRKLAMPNG
ncbi:hypothetical protein [Azospirillum palustre]